VLCYYFILSFQFVSDGISRLLDNVASALYYSVYRVYRVGLSSNISSLQKEGERKVVTYQVWYQ